jgi:methyl-accepting chemotaxis protein
VNLQQKLTLSLAVGLLVPLAVVQAIQFLHIRSELAAIAAKNEGILETMATKNIENIERASTGFIARGEMDDLDKQIDQIRTIPGLIEYSLTDAKGVAKYSSIAAHKRQTLPADIKDRLLSAGEPVIRRSGNALQVYRPLLATADCAACHQKWKTGQVGGVQFFSFSDKDLVDAQAQATGSFRAVEANTILWFVGTAIIVAVILVGLTAWLLRLNFGRTVESALKKLAGGVTHTSNAVEHLAATSQQLAEGASGQAAALEETSASLEEIASMAKHNADSAGNAKTISEQTLELAEGGATSVTGMRQAMAEITRASTNIAEIVKDIDQISFQTNLLALNAAVEAARAGEAGAGFAVVADEVRRLAQRSAQSAKRTAAMIDDSVQRSERGAAISDEVARAFERIVANAKRVDAVVAEIANGSREQGQGIGQLNSAVASMDEVTQKNAFTAEESARAARALDAQAKMLRGVVADLNALFNAQHSTTVAEPVLSVPNGRNINSFERLNGAMAQTGGAPVVGKQGRLG